MGQRNPRNTQKRQKRQNSLRRAALAHPIHEENIQNATNHQINPNYLQRRFTRNSPPTFRGRRPKSKNSWSIGSKPKYNKNNTRRRR